MNSRSSDFDAINRAAYWDDQREELDRRTNRRSYFLRRETIAHARRIKKKAGRRRATVTTPVVRFSGAVAALQASSDRPRSEVSSVGVKRWIVDDWFWQRCSCSKCLENIQIDQPGSSAESGELRCEPTRSTRISNLGDCQREKLMGIRDRRSGLCLPNGTTHGFKGKAADAICRLTSQFSTSNAAGVYCISTKQELESGAENESERRASQLGRGLKMPGESRS